MEVKVVLSSEDVRELGETLNADREWIIYGTDRAGNGVEVVFVPWQPGEEGE